MSLNPSDRKRRGSALGVALVFVLLCAAVSGATLMASRGWQNAASAELSRERAFQLAEAGVDWAVARMRARRGTLPTSAETGAIPSVGAWRVTYGPGHTNGFDDDGDGATDESDEARFTGLVSTGTAGGISRSIRVLLRAPQGIGSFDAVTVFNVDAPILDVNGNAFRINGSDHFIDGTMDTARPQKWAVASPATTSTLLAQIPTNRRANLPGLGGAPSLGQSAPIDLDSLMEQSHGAATTVLTPGTYSNRTFGTPVVGQTEVVSVVGDVHIAGNLFGAGILAVDGDLTITGSFQWTGIVLVRGRVRFSGGGNTKKLVGAVIVGEEVGDTGGGGELTVSGTIDMLYSSDAIALAAQSLVVPVVVLWQETGNS